MKKKVLFALIALCSFLSTWAADVVTVGGYDVTLSSKVVALPATGNATAPEVTSVKTGTSGNLLKAVDQTAYQISDGKLVAATLNAVGNYFLKVTTTDSKTLVVPFIVGKQVATEIVFNQATYDASLAGGFEKAYHENTTDQYAATYDVWDPTAWTEPNPKAAPTTENGYEYSIEPLVKPTHDLFDSPFIGFVVPEGTEGTYDLGIHANGKTGFMRGGEFSAAVGHNFTFWSFANETGGNFMFAQFYDNDNLAKYRFAKTVGTSSENRTKIWKYNSDPDADKVEATYVEEALEATQSMANGDLAKSINFFLVPTANPYAVSITLDYYETVYAGILTRNPQITLSEEGFNGDLTWYAPDGSTFAGTIYVPGGDGNDSPDANNPFAAVGTYTLVATIDDNLCAVAEYVVKPLELTVGAGNLYIGYGDDDPTEPSYGTVWSQLATGDVLEDIHISGLSVVRKTPKTGTDPEPVNTVIPYTIIEDNPTTGNPNYSLKVTPTDGNIIVTRKFLSEPEFTVTVNDDNNIYDGTAQMPTVTVKRGEQTLVEGTDYEVSLAPVEEDADAIDNVNANVHPDGTFIDVEGEHIPIIITGIGNYTSTVKVDGVETEEPIEEEFDIKQRDLRDLATPQVTVATIDAVTYQAVAHTPTPAVSFMNSKNEPYTLNYKEGDGKVVEYTYAYNNNTYASNNETGVNKYVAQCIVEAKYEGEGEAKNYTGNFYGSRTIEFTINKFAFVLKPDPTLGKLFGMEEPALTAVADPTTPDEKLDDVDLEDVVEYELQRVAGENVGVYSVTFKTAPALKNDPINLEEPKSAPTNNYTMTSADGTFEITTAEGGYFVSSKKVTREYDGTDNIPFDGFYLYTKATNDGVDTYTLVPTTSPLYNIIKPTKNVLRESRNNNETGRTAGRDVRRNASHSWWIMPDVTGLSTDDYTVSVMPENTHPQEGEGFFLITKKAITLVADNKSSEYGKSPLATPTVSAYEGATLTKDANGNITNKALSETLTAELRYNAPTVVGVTPESAVGKHAGTIQFDGYFGSGNNRQSISANGNTNTNNANPNYSITLVNGDYTITETHDVIAVAVTWTKAFGQTDAEAKITNVTVTHPNKTTYTLSADDQSAIKFTREAGASEAVNNEGYNVTVTGNETIDGYGVTYTGKLVITEAGEVVIAINNQTVDYGTEPTKTFAAPYATITGLPTGVTAESLGLSIVFEKPATGYVKNGGALKVKCGDKILGTTAEVSATDWAWVADYTKVSVKQGKVYVNADDEITLDIVAFNKANYDEDADVNDEIIRDYAGTEVGKVTIKASKQDINAPEDDQYTVKGGQWYSMVLPFKASPRDIQEIFNGYAAVDVLNKTNVATKASEIRFALTTDSVPANEPFVAKTDLDFVFKPVTIEAAAGKGILIEYPLDEDGNLAAVVEDGNENQFIGTYKAFFADGETKTNDKGRTITKYYDLINLSEGNISPASPGAYVRPLGAYIKVAEEVDNAHAPLRISFEEADGTTTVIDAVEVEGTEVAYGEGWYTINGIKLEGEPATTGTYIFNGKKVFIQK